MFPIDPKWSIGTSISKVDIATSLKEHLGSLGDHSTMNEQKQIQETTNQFFSSNFRHRIASNILPAAEGKEMALKMISKKSLALHSELSYVDDHKINYLISWQSLPKQESPWTHLSLKDFINRYR